MTKSGIKIKLNKTKGDKIWKINKSRKWLKNNNLKNRNKYEWWKKLKEDEIKKKN